MQTWDCLGTSHVDKENVFFTEVLWWSKGTETELSELSDKRYVGNSHLQSMLMEQHAVGQSWCISNQ